jgi:hypothetical protein
VALAVKQAVRASVSTFYRLSNERSSAIYPRDWILLALAHTPGGRLQPVQLQKALCVLGQQVPASTLQCEHFYDFSPSEYGPFSAAIDSDIEESAQSGVVLVSDDPWPARHLLLTPRGYDTARRLIDTQAPEAAQCLTKIVAWITSFGVRDLLRVDVATFPRIDFPGLGSMDDSTREYGFIASVETWGCGGQPLDILTLKDGSVLLVTEATVVLYENLVAFETDMGGRAISRMF